MMSACCSLLSFMRTEMYANLRGGWGGDGRGVVKVVIFRNSQK